MIYSFNETLVFSEFLFLHGQVFTHRTSHEAADLAEVVGGALLSAYKAPKNQGPIVSMPGAVAILQASRSQQAQP